MTAPETNVAESRIIADECDKFEDEDLFEAMPIISPTISNQNISNESNGADDLNNLITERLKLNENDEQINDNNDDNNTNTNNNNNNNENPNELNGVLKDLQQQILLSKTSTNPHEEIKNIEGKRNLLPETLPIVECIARARIPTTQGPEIFLHLYSNNIDNKEHLAIVFGEDIRSKSLFRKREGETQTDRMTRGAYVGKLYPGRRLADKDERNNIELKFDSKGEIITDEINTIGLNKEKPVLARIHSECYTGETAWSARCDCGEQFDEAGRLMGDEGYGCIVYLRQEGRGIGLGEKLKAYNLQDLGADTVQANLLLRHPADKRSFSLATAILMDLNLINIKLLTNNPDKIVAVEGKNRNVQVIERVPMIPLHWQNPHDGIKSKEVEGYLRTKVERMGHLLSKPAQV